MLFYDRAASGHRLAVACLTLVPVAALAGPQPAFFESHVNTNSGSKVSNSPGDLNGSYQDLTSGALEYGDAYIGTQPVPLISSDAETTKAGASASAALVYFVTISGPLSVKVPIIASVTSAQTSVMLSTGGSDAQAGATSRLQMDSVDDFTGTYLFSANDANFDLAAYGNPLQTDHKIKSSYAMDLRANDGYVRVAMSVNSTIYDLGTSNFSGKASAILDPYFYIDPSFADASLYTIQVSPGLGNSPVPEPASMSGLALGIGILMRRRRPRA